MIEPDPVGSEDEFDFLDDYEMDEDEETIFIEGIEVPADLSDDELDELRELIINARTNEFAEELGKFLSERYIELEWLESQGELDESFFQE